MRRTLLLALAILPAAGCAHSRPIVSVVREYRYTDPGDLSKVEHDRTVVWNSPAHSEGLDPHTPFLRQIPVVVKAEIERRRRPRHATTVTVESAWEETIR